MSKFIKLKGGTREVSKITPLDYLSLVPKATKEEYENLTGKRLSKKDIPKQWEEIEKQCSANPVNTKEEPKKEVKQEKPLT